MLHVNRNEVDQTRIYKSSDITLLNAFLFSGLHGSIRYRREYSEVCTIYQKNFILRVNVGNNGHLSWRCWGSSKESEISFTISFMKYNLQFIFLRWTSNIYLQFYDKKEKSMRGRVTPANLIEFRLNEIHPKCTVPLLM